jgi:hypothetical protein
MTSPAVMDMAQSKSAVPSPRDLDHGENRAIRLQELGLEIMQISTSDPAAVANRIVVMKRIERLFDGFPKGTLVAVDYASGTYFTGNDRASVLQTLQDRFGTSTRGQLFEVGVPVMVGGWGR